MRSLILSILFVAVGCSSSQAPSDPAAGPKKRPGVFGKIVENLNQVREDLVALGESYDKGKAEEDLETLKGRLLAEWKVLKAKLQDLRDRLNRALQDEEGAEDEAAKEDTKARKEALMKEIEQTEQSLEELKEKLDKEE